MRLRNILAATVLLLGAACTPFACRFLEEDACLDAGGRVLSGHRCDLGDGPVRMGDVWSAYEKRRAAAVPRDATDPAGIRPER